MHCKKATFLLSKREENKLTWLEQVQLRTHLGLCGACKHFEKQTMIITCLVKEIRQKETLPENIKQQIQSQLR
ncbi:anti-sigma factor family protein [Sediminibacterium soli]|uniref:anti-sigma factor family protein n=1 Tax=Sediminibacterium soli TaxID=2698829 RepID=UPI00137A4288|nr:zf-HC2 domain-containing protein [Sediminibacterium soli]NCI46132.1 zf-HC2 domain-containing protein [Sediminibacterium soli]